MNDDAVITDDSGPILAFQNLHYEVSVSNGISTSKRTILKGADGIMEPGLNAVMGSSGCGKTSLLKILSGRMRVNKSSHVSGKVIFNGKTLPKDFCRMCGYVDQRDDVFVETLSIRENMMFSASLALAYCLTESERSQKVDSILETFGLKECSHLKIEAKYESGLSGGEKRRCSIALALISDPKLLFIDEPTSGLDASTASSIMILLDKLSSEGRTIIISIHQPRNLIFKLFNSITLLSYDGQVVFHGSRSQARNHFQSIGVSCGERCNPADIYSEIICNRGQSNDTQFLSDSLAFDVDVAELHCGYYQSDIYRSTLQKIDNIIVDDDDDDHLLVAPPIRSSSFHQCCLLSRRSFKNLSRRVMLSFGNEVLAYLGFGIFFGLLFFQLGNNAPEDIQNRFGILFLTVNFNLFMSLSFIGRFTKERHILRYEYEAGYYHLITYYLAKLFADFLPNRTLIPLILCTLSYWIAGLKADANSFFTHLLMVMLVVYASVSVALFLAVLFDNKKIADVVTFLVFLASIFVAGLLIDIDRLTWLSWTKYLSVAYYGFSSLAINEFRDTIFYNTSCLQSSSLVDNLPTEEISSCIVLGELLLAEQLGISLDLATYDNISHRNTMCLSGMTVLMLTMAYFTLYYRYI